MLKLGIDFGNVIRGSDGGLMHDVIPALLKLKRFIFGDEIYLISRVFDDAGEQRNRQFMLDHGITGPIIPESNLHFCLERDEKAPIAEQLGLTHFVDDRLQVLSYMTSITYLYALNPTASQRHDFPVPNVKIVSSWREITEDIIWNASDEEMLSSMTSASSDANTTTPVDDE